MTVTYGFYDSLSGDRLYNASQMSRLFEGIIAEGIFQSVGAGFVVSPNSGMNINVGTGRAWLKLTWTLNDAALVLAVDSSEAALNRIDTVVIEVNKDVSVRSNTIKIVKGTPATTPVAPTLVNTSTLGQYPLANIYVGLGVTAINAGNITNRVAVAGGTPFITGLLSSFDVATLFGQYTSSFETWFANLQDQLDDNQAGNLQNQIDSLDGTRDTGWIPILDTWTYASTNTINAPTALVPFKKGWGVRFKQGGGFKYMYITALSANLLTVYAGSDFVVSNAAITDVSITKEPLNAFGFPEDFNWLPVHGRATTPYTNLPLTMHAKFIISGAKIYITEQHIQDSVPGGSGNALFSLPQLNKYRTILFSTDLSIAKVNMAYAEGGSGLVLLFAYDGSDSLVAGRIYVVNGEYLY